MISPFKCFANESFTDVLLGRGLKEEAFFADQDLWEELMDLGRDMGLKNAVCATVSSLKLEEEMFDSFVSAGIEALDMECSAFFSAAAHSKIAAVALFYATDIIKDLPFYATHGPVSKITAYSGLKRATNLLRFFIRERAAGRKT
jgi:hypothetical protein